MSNQYFKLYLFVIFLVAIPIDSMAERVLGISQRVFEKLDEVQTLIDEKEYKQALVKLDEISQKRLNYYEKAQIHRLKGHAYYLGNDYNNALNQYEAALSIKRIPASMTTNLSSMMARVYMATDNHDKAVATLENLIAMPKQKTPDNLHLLAVAHYQNSSYEKSKQLISQMIEEKNINQESIPEHWLRLQVANLFELKDFTAARDTLQLLSESYTKKKYLMNLAIAHGQLGDQQNQLAIVETLSDAQQITKVQNIKMLANMYLNLGLPIKAANILDSNIKSKVLEENERNLELLSRAWYQAGEIEKALSSLAKASDKAESGNLFVRLSRLYSANFQWKEALIAANQALKKGALKDEGHAWLLHGIANTRLKNLDKATNSFYKASKFEKTEKHAKQWLNYLTNLKQQQDITTT